MVNFYSDSILSIRWFIIGRDITRPSHNMFDILRNNVFRGIMYRYKWILLIKDLEVYRF